MISTKRLLLIPLNEELLAQYVALDGSLEESLGATNYPRSISLNLQSALINVIIPRVRARKQDMFFTTLWTAVDQEKQVMVGDICFKGAPDGRGRVEIGYGTYPDFQQQGYMSEMVEGISRWAFTQPKVRTVVAETHMENKASQTVLSRNGFIQFETIPPMIWWKLNRQTVVNLGL